jgi:hypothetical protein
MSHEPPRKPDRVDRLGKMSVSTWNNPVDKNGTQADRFTFSIQKRYLDRDTQTYQTAQSYYLDDLPALIAILEVVLQRHLGASSVTRSDVDFDPASLDAVNEA